MNVKNKFKLSSVALASAMALGAMTASTTASAEVSYSATLSSMYFWRGQNISDGAPALSGDISYSHDSGLYAFAWMSSEGVSGTSTATNTTGDDDGGEVDVGIGYAGEVGGVGYDISYYKFWYPEEDSEVTSFGDADAEFVLGLSYDPVSFTAYIDAKGDKTYKYYTLGGSVGPVDLTYGMTDNDGASNDYTHIDVTYNATDKLSFTVSKKSLDAGITDIDEDYIFVMSYSLPVGK